MDDWGGTEKLTTSIMTKFFKINESKFIAYRYVWRRAEFVTPHWALWSLAREADYNMLKVKNKRRQYVISNTGQGWLRRNWKVHYLNYENLSKRKRIRKNNYKCDKVEELKGLLQVSETQKNYLSGLIFKNFKPTFPSQWPWVHLPIAKTTSENRLPKNSCPSWWAASAQQWFQFHGMPLLCRSFC